MDNNKIGKFIASKRKELGLTQQELATKISVTDKAVSKWERGISLPDTSILEKLSKELDVSIDEIINGKKKEDKEELIEKEVNKKIDELNKKKKEKNKKKILKLLISGLCIFLILIITLVINYNINHPKRIYIGDTKYSFFNYRLEKKGLSEMEKIVNISEKTTTNYNVSYLNVKLNKNGKLEEFTLTIKFFDNNKNYVGRGAYIYKKNNLNYSYVSKEDEKSLLVDVYSKNNNLEYISSQIKKIPLKKQIKASDLDYYFLSYSPNTSLEWGSPIFDGRDNKKIKVLSWKDYNKGIGGESDKGIFFVLRLNDGRSIVSGKQYLYVFDSLEEGVPVNPNYMMDVDYYINNGKLMFTRDYGNTWIDTDITESALRKTLNFYGGLSLKTNSWFLDKNELIPIAYFYGYDPILKISNDNGKTWSSHEFISSKDTFDKPITSRIVGFTSQNFGYVGLGTDWTMGSGEIKKLYFTYNGGKDWKEIDIPLNGTSHVLYDVCMYDENVGVVVLKDTTNSNFPLIYSTVSGGKSWNEVRYRDGNLPDEISYLSEVDSISKEGESYFIKLGQGDTGTLKANFRSGDMMGWTYMSIAHENIHTVG